MRAVFLLLILLPAFTSFCAQNDSLLFQLHRTIEKKDVYVKEKQVRIVSYHEELKSNPSKNGERQFYLLNQLSEEYKTFIYDSAFTYTRQLLNLAYVQHNVVRIAYAKTKLGFVLLSSGMFKEALDSLQDLSMKGIPDSIRAEYYSIMWRTYYDLVDFDVDHYYTSIYRKLGDSYIDSARNLYPADSYNYIYLTSVKNLRTGNPDPAVDDLKKLWQRPHLTQRQIAILASTLGLYYVSDNQPDEAVEWLAIASIADLKGSIKETVALYRLADLLYRQDDIKNAYVFIQQAMDDATFYGARQRKVQVGSILPLIAAAQLSSVEEQRKMWLIYSSLITVLTLLALTFAVMLFLELKKRRIAEKALKEANRIKEEYIWYYFIATADHIAKLDSLKKSLDIKLLTKKPEELKFIVDSINIKREREELYHNFDVVFLKLFPDFVIVFNSLFKEEDRIVLKEGQLLNTELRIFALIRMGVHDHEKIARILDYSVNTIYTYKTRVRNKSILSGEEFDKQIMSIRAI